MLTKLKKSKGEGFTIIEVMIVLAIAGLILLIVFLAIPALQRTSRNTQRKNDAANLDAAVQNFITNNQATLPVGIGQGAAGKSSIDFCAAGGVASGAPGATACTPSSNRETANLSYFNSSTVFAALATPGSAAAPTPTQPGTETAGKVSSSTVIVEFDQTCGTSLAGAYDSRSVAVWFVTESSTGLGSLQCVS